MNKFPFAALVLIFTAITVTGQQYRKMSDVNGFMDKLQKMSGSVSTIESNFIQEKNLSVLSNKIISKGIFRFRKENNIRWEYTEPYKYLIILSGNNIYISDKSGSKQYDVQSNRMFQEMNTFIKGCIQGDILKNSAGYETEYLENDNEYFVRLVPVSQAMRDMLNEVQITFDKKDLTVSRITMVELGGDYTRIDFVNKKINVDVPLETFSFK
jgi:outer membrane lipoprotein-sorting protein